MADGDESERSLPERVFQRVVGSVVSPIVDNVDVDDVVERIDVNNLIDRVAVNEVLDEVDVDRILDRIDADRLLDRVDANRLLDRVDVNGLLDRVEPDELLDRVDANRLLDRVEPDRLLDRVDPDRLLDRVDVNRLLDRVDPDPILDRVDADRLLERVDVNRLVERTELGTIIARSTTGVFTEVLDVARTQVGLADLVAHGVPARVLRGSARELPPRPGEPDDHVEAERMTPTERAVELQGRAAGSVSRFLAFLIDQFAIGVLFGILTVLVQTAIRVVIDPSFDLDEARVPIVVFYAAWAFLYTAASVAASGRTIGKGVLGLMVKRTDGRMAGGRAASIRALAFPLSFLLLGIGFLIGLIRHDRRQLHDLIAGTSVVYAWDAQAARVRARALEQDLTLR